LAEQKLITGPRKRKVPDMLREWGPTRASLKRVTRFLKKRKKGTFERERKVEDPSMEMKNRHHRGGIGYSVSNFEASEAR